MEPHSHPESERTFDRVANIMEALANQLEALTNQASRTSDQIGMLTQLATVFREDLDRLAVRDAETTDKLNALIDLMDRHRQEHHDGK